jgi:murein DD-endopeptidase MepM/ murein hydrolase activator NlpD
VCSSDLFLHSVYAHSNPVDGLRQGQKVKKGEHIADVADISGRNLSIPGHLHVSMVYLPEDYPKDMLKWQILAISYQARLVDPIGFFDCRYKVKKFNP